MTARIKSIRLSRNPHCDAERLRQELPASHHERINHEAAMQARRLRQIQRIKEKSACRFLP